MDNHSSRYDKRGVSANKEEVHAAIKNISKGLFPNAFCKIIEDLVGNDSSFCNIMHADTAGTKTSLAYIYWKETGDVSVWEGIVQDALIMNLDDLACVGCIENIVVSSTIGRNKNVIPGEVISTIINYAETFVALLNKYDLNISLAGGETADVGDIVRTIDVGYTAFARMKREDVISIDIKDGDYIVGFSSSGQAHYESAYNGGMGSNGLTSARHDVFNKSYASKYPESFNELLPLDVVYSGNRNLLDAISINGVETTIGKLVLSPTRTYLPLLKLIVPKYRSVLNGIIHCSGGGQTKVSKFMGNDIHIIKDNMMPIPTLFTLIQEESGASDHEMYQVFNMGHRLECYTGDLNAAHDMIAISNSLGIDAAIIGRVEASNSPKISIKTEKGSMISYDF